MKQLNVPLLSHIDQGSSIEQVAASLIELPKQAIDIAPWPAFQYRPKVEFSIAHNNKSIFLKYEVEEEVLKAVYNKPDDPVYKDSCVEFFIALDEIGYYNLEWNAIGTCKLNFGTGRNNRLVISEELVKRINFLSLIQNTYKGLRWELCLVIPLNVFSRHEVTSFSGRICRANFYKCGDDLPTPHFLCWNRIETPEPDFHVLEGFGEIQFL
jgi:hypothetical protein